MEKRGKRRAYWSWDVQLLLLCGWMEADGKKGGRRAGESNDLSISYGGGPRSDLPLRAKRVMFSHEQHRYDVGNRRRRLNKKPTNNYFKAVVFGLLAFETIPTLETPNPRILFLNPSANPLNTYSWPDFLHPVISRLNLPGRIGYQSPKSSSS